MRIGFFGDSYCDLVYKHVDTPRSYKPWARRLVEDNNLECYSSGLGGSNQFYAINQWLQFVEKNIRLDFAVFTFTWHDRLYSQSSFNQEIFSAIAEKRDIGPIIKLLNTWDNVEIEYPEKVKLATEYYYDYLYNEEQSKFNYKLQLQYILKLPEKFPDTNFIFIPNTEFARTIALDNFTNGCLINFAFETLSNREKGSPGIMPINCNRVGHLSDRNNDLISIEFSKIVLNYTEYKDKIYEFDYNKFDIE